MLLQKPHRTLSNISIHQLEKVKEFCRNSFQEYKQKFNYEPDQDVLHNKKIMKKSFKKRKNMYSDQIASEGHKFFLRRPSTAYQINNKSLSRTQTEQKQSQNISALFHNQHLSSTLQQSCFQSSKKQVRPSKKFSISRQSSVGFEYFMKTPNEEKRQVQTMINTILSVKENFYNPYHIEPKGKSNRFFKPIKNLRSSSIKQLKQLCQEERNLNFNLKLIKEEPRCQTVTSVSKLKLINSSHNLNRFSLDESKVVKTTKPSKTKLTKKLNQKFSNNRLKEFSKNFIVKNQNLHINKITH